MAERTPFDPYAHLWRLKPPKKSPVPGKKFEYRITEAAVLVLLLLAVFVLGYACGQVVTTP